MTPASRTRVYLVDNHPVFLEAVAEAIRARPELELVGSAATGPDAVAGIDELQPDVAVLDMRLPGLSGQEVLRSAVARSERTRVLVLSAHIESELVYAALAGGAVGYLSKDVDRDAICKAIVAVADGAIVLSPDVQRSLVGAIRYRNSGERPALTLREQTVLALAAEGFTTREMAARLGVGAATVKTHLQSIYSKLRVSDRASAVAVAMRQGLLE